MSLEVISVTVAPRDAIVSGTAQIHSDRDQGPIALGEAQTHSDRDQDPIAAQTHNALPQRANALIITSSSYLALYISRSQGVLQKRPVSLSTQYTWGNRGTDREVPCPHSLSRPVQSQEWNPGLLITVSTASEFLLQHCFLTPSKPPKQLPSPPVNLLRGPLLLLKKILPRFQEEKTKKNHPGSKSWS